jgi:hypothetical protein
MAQKKEVKVNDLKPIKDAKGGASRSNQSSARTQQNLGILNQNLTTKNRGNKFLQ